MAAPLQTDIGQRPPSPAETYFPDPSLTADAAGSAADAAGPAADTARSDAPGVLDTGWQTASFGDTPSVAADQLPATPAAAPSAAAPATAPSAAAPTAAGPSVAAATPRRAGESSHLPGTGAQLHSPPTSRDH